MGRCVDGSDTLKRHERLHDRVEGPSFRRARSNARQSPPPESTDEAENPASTAMGTSPQQPRPFVTFAATPSPSNTTVPDSGFPGNQLAFSTSPTFPHQPDPLLDPFAVTENIPMSFGFDIQALNAFLTSGDFDALLGTHAADPIALPPTQPLLLPERPLHSKQFPLLSDAIQASWFTNLQERDLEKEAVETGTALDMYSSRQHESHGKQNEAGNIDEAWREKIKSNMIPKTFDILGPFPSIEFLVPLTPESQCANHGRTCALIYIFKSFIRYIPSIIVQRSKSRV
jgi:hypothetical protein